MPQLLPQQVEDLRFGMNSLDSPKKLNAGVWQLIENMLPGISGKPRNALNEKMAKTDTTGYSNSHSFFRPNWQHISAGGKDFFIGWTRTDNASYKDEYQLEVWNLTDNTRTKLEYGEFNADLVFFGFNKLYNALYCVFDYEMKTNHTSAYRTKNKILEYVSGAWAVREMGIDCVPVIDQIKTEDAAAAALPTGLTQSCLVVFENKVWIIGGLASGAGTRKVFVSSDNVKWSEVGTDQFPTTIYRASVIVFKNKMWVIGGIVSAGNYSKKVFYSTDGITWTEAGTDALPFAIYDSVLLAFGNMMWIIAPDGGSSQQSRCTYSSSDGVTWSLVGNQTIPNSGAGRCGVVYNSKMWLIGGYALKTVHYSTDGITWTEAGTDALPYTLYKSASVVFDFKMWIIGGYQNGNPSTVSKKVFYSTDGITWTEAGTDALSSTLFGHYAAIFKNKITVFGGFINSLTAWNWKIISSIDGSSWSPLVGGVTKDYFVSIATTFVKRTTSIGSDTAIFEAPLNESVEDLTQRQVVKMLCSTTTGTLLIPMPDPADAIAQGATHMRVWRTLSDVSESVAAGLTHRYLCDISLTAAGFSMFTIYHDITPDSALIGETNFLETTGYDVPPQGRFTIWAGGRQWIGGNPDNKGYWFYSELPANTRYPQKYASMFRLDQYFNTCDPSDGQYDTGVCELSGDLYFFKERKIFALAGANPDNVPTLISDGIGCAFPHTLVVADVPILGGRCAMFISESGPAILTAGGQVRLLNEFKIAELWPSGTGNIIKLSTGIPTDWYTRNKVTGCYWNNTYWIFFGDSRDAECNLATNKLFGFHFGIDGVSVGPLQVTLPQQVYNSVAYTICEPQMLIPVDNNRAYTLSHKTDRSAAKVYRLLQFLDPAKWQDTYLTEGAIGYSMVARTRYLYAGSNHTDFATPKAAVVHMTFADTSGLTITVTCDATRLISANTYAQTRQSGMGADNLLRHFLWDVLPADGAGRGSFFDVKVSKVVPSTGAVEFFGTQIEVDDIVVEREYSSPSSSYTGSTTYVKQADAAGGEENAY